MRGCQCPHDAEAGALPQMQVENDHIDFFVACHGYRDRFRIRHANQRYADGTRPPPPDLMFSLHRPKAR